MTERPHLSVVVCADGDDPFERTVASVSRSAERAAVPIELIVAAQPPRGAGQRPVAGARTLELLPLGAAYARNRGFEAASGDVVAFLDADVSVAEGWAEAVLADFRLTPRPSAVVGPAGPSARSRLLQTGNVAFWASAFRALRGFDRALGAPGGRGGPETLELLLRAREGGETVVFDPEAAATALGSRRASQGLHFGRLMRRRRDPTIGARYLAAVARRPRELVRAVPALVAGAINRDPGLPPAALLEHMPPGISGLLGGAVPEPFGPTHRAKTHFLYRVGDRVLHVYANPSERLRAALGERESIRQDAGLAGIPRLHAAVEGRDAIWVLEDFVPGERPEGQDANAWFPSVAQWAVDMAGQPSAPLGKSPAWEVESRALVECAPDGFGAPLEAALDAVSALGAVHMHGDFQRHNLRLAGGRVGLVDWEGAWRAGIPGLDLVFCSLLAESDVPDERVLSTLAAGSDHPTRPLRPHLARLGITDAVLSCLLLVHLACWSLGEERRLSRLGAPAGSPIFRPLLLRLGVGLTELT